MTVKFILVQLIGLCALFMLVLSLQNNNKKMLMKYQMFSSLLYAVQYAFLGAYTGCLLNLTCVFRNYIFGKNENGRASIIWLIVVLAHIVGFSLITYTDIVSLLVMFGIILFSVAMWYGDLTFMRIGEAIACALLMIYNVKVLAFTSCIATMIEISTVLIAIYRFDLKKIKPKKEVRA